MHLSMVVSSIPTSCATFEGRMRSASGKKQLVLALST